MGHFSILGRKTKGGRKKGDYISVIIFLFLFVLIKDRVKNFSTPVHQN